MYSSLGSNYWLSRELNAAILVFARPALPEKDIGCDSLRDGRVVGLKLFMLWPAKAYQKSSKPLGDCLS